MTTLYTNIDKVQVNDDGTGKLVLLNGMTISIRTDPVAVSPPPPPPPPPSVPIIGGYFDGVPDDRAALIAGVYGMKWVRLWHSINWNETLGKDHPTFVRARALRAIGLKVLVVFTPPEKTGAPPATPDIAATYFVSAQLAAGGCVDAWEIWNEPNLSNYNTSYATKSTLWIKNGLAPAYTALHNAGQFVVSGGWSEGLLGFPWMISNGLLSFCDAVGYHPYGSNYSEQVDRVEAMRGFIGDKPLWLTEWNLHMDKDNPAVWVNNLAFAATQIRPLVQAVFYFRMIFTTQPAGVAAPLNPDLSPRSIWNEGTLAALKALTA